MNLLRFLPNSGMINWREVNEQGKHLILGKEYDQSEKKLELSPPECLNNFGGVSRHHLKTKEEEFFL